MVYIHGITVIRHLELYRVHLSYADYPNTDLQMFCFLEKNTETLVFILLDSADIVPKKAMDLIRNIPCTKYFPRHVRRTQLFTQTTNLFSLYVFLYFVNTTDFYWDDFVLALKISQLTKCTRSAKCTLSASVKCF